MSLQLREKNNEPLPTNHHQEQEQKAVKGITYTYTQAFKIH